jgi:diadenosine tetraphosphate (Ap4A) HIT family hydrolase
MKNQINETILKFGYPNSLIKEFQHWVVLLRPKQVTLGCVIVACKEPAECLPDVSADAYQELKQVTLELESALKRAFDFQKINYILLMMVDKHVHFHVIPRYSANRQLGSRQVADPGWPKHPDMNNVIDFSDSDIAEIQRRIVEVWPR